MGEASASTEPYSSLGSRGCSNNILPVAVGAPGTSSKPDLPVGSLDCDGMLEETDTAELLTNPVTILTESCDAGCQVNTRGMRLMMKSTGTQIYKSSFEVTVCDQTTQTDVHVDEEVTNSGNEMDPPSEHEHTETMLPLKDPSFVPSESDEILSDDSISDKDSSKNPKPQDDVKFIVFKQNLFQLLKLCPECGAAVRKNHASTQGTQLFVRLNCINGHASLWQSQPMIKGMAAGNLLLPSSILWGHLH